MSWTTAILHLFSQDTDLLMKVIIKCVNIKHWDILGCFHYILNAPRKLKAAVEALFGDQPDNFYTKGIGCLKESEPNALK